MDDISTLSFFELLTLRTHLTATQKRQSAPRDTLAAQAALLERVQVEIDSRVQKHIERIRINVNKID